MYTVAAISRLTLRLFSIWRSPRHWNSYDRLELGSSKRHSPDAVGMFSLIGDGSPFVIFLDAFIMTFIVIPRRSGTTMLMVEMFPDRLLSFHLKNLPKIVYFNKRIVLLFLVICCSL